MGEYRRPFRAEVVTFAFSTPSTAKAAPDSDFTCFEKSLPPRLERLIFPPIVEFGAILVTGKGLMGRSQRRIEDDCIREVVRMQEDADLHSITDGEFRRFMFHIDFLERIKGVEKRPAPFKRGFAGGDSDHDDFTPMIFEVDSKISHDRDIAVDDFASPTHAVGAVPSTPRHIPI